MQKPTLLLHACCAPCSSFCLETLDNVFDITLFFYNPNISSKEEYTHRLSELQRLVKEMPLSQNIEVIDGGYSHTDFLSASKGLESEPERGLRCNECFYLRLNAVSEYAQKNNFDYFSTTLTISPHKNAELINKIGFSLGELNTKAKWLFSDFKKNEGYKRSIILSEEYNLYRQNFCGCEFSK